MNSEGAFLLSSSPPSRRFISAGDPTQGLAETLIMSISWRFWVTQMTSTLNQSTQNRYRILQEGRRRNQKKNKM